MAKGVTQCDRILQYIRRFGSITSWQAYVDLGITQLAARIFELKELGYEFTTTRIETKNRFDEKTHHFKYELCKGEN